MPEDFETEVAAYKKREGIEDGTSTIDDYCEQMRKEGLSEEQIAKIREEAEKEQLLIEGMMAAGDYEMEEGEEAVEIPEDEDSQEGEDELKAEGSGEETGEGSEDNDEDDSDFEDEQLPEDHLGDMAE